MQSQKNIKWSSEPISKTRRNRKAIRVGKSKFLLIMRYFKNFMTIVGIIAITSIILGFVSDGNSANEKDQQFLTVRVFEATQVSSFIIIVDENGKQETVELEKPVKKEPLISNVVKINKTLNSIGEKGYKLVSQSGAGDPYVILTTYTFVKK